MCDCYIQTSEQNPIRITFTLTFWSGRGNMKFLQFWSIQCWKLTCNCFINFSLLSGSCLVSSWRENIPYFIKTLKKTLFLHLIFSDKNKRNMNAYRRVGFLWIRRNTFLFECKTYFSISLSKDNETTSVLSFDFRPKIQHQKSWIKKIFAT